jgi:hypothetical protein
VAARTRAGQGVAGQVLIRRLGLEPGSRCGHPDPLMGPARVVVADPVVDDLLGHLQAGERRQGGQQLGPQGLVEPFHLPSGGWTPDPGEPVDDGVLATDAVEQHLSRARLAEAAGELAPIVGQHLGRHPIAGQGGGEGRADGSAGGPSDQGSDHAIAGVVINPADQLHLRAVSQPDPTDDVQLPQLHRCLTLPTAEVASPAPGGGWAPPARDGPGCGRSQPAAALHQRRGGPTRAGVAAAPTGMLAAQLTDSRLDLREA